MANLVQEFLTDVKTDIGDPYVFGAAGPKQFDCSGLIYYNLRKIGIKNVPRTSEEQWKWATHIKRSELQPGDLIFMNFGNEVSPGHVVIYAGNGKIIQAPHTGADVQEVPLSSMGNGSEIVGYGRVPGLTGTATNGGGGIADAPALAEAGGLSVGGAPLSGLEQLGKDALGIVGGTASTIGDVASSIQGIGKDVNTAMHFLAVLGKPAFWLRIGAFIVGLISAGVGVYFLGKSIGVQGPSAPAVMPVPV